MQSAVVTAQARAGTHVPLVQMVCYKPHTLQLTHLESILIYLLTKEN